jgi:ElaB/YqjD/DUF883 family membrane-anchored ribosome-binding protein
MIKAIPAPIQTVLDLFTTSLADVRFADVDGETLLRFAAEVETAAEAVAAAQATLDAAREALQEKQDTLLQQTQRALAYARVYAEGDDALIAQLDAVSLPRAARRSRPEDPLVLSADPESPSRPSRPRGRPRRTTVAQPTLEAIASPAE